MEKTQKQTNKKFLETLETVKPHLSAKKKNHHFINLNFTVTIYHWVPLALINCKPVISFPIHREDKEVISFFLSW